MPRQATPGTLAKRLLDLFLASCALLVFAPALAIIALIIKLGDGGTVFYRGLRVGRGERPFRIFKFRTMVLNADRSGNASTADDDPRITWIGKILRRTKIDELPQLINVLRGEMSLVGPRPQVPSKAASYTPEERKVFEIQPGMTDYSSLRFRNEGEILKGSADPDKAYWILIHPEKMRLALHYVRTRSLRTDLALILHTLGAVLGIAPDPEGYSGITEQWGMDASPEQISMSYTRYRWARDHSSGRRVLEAACGVGMGIGYLAGAARQAVGGDFTWDNIFSARRRLPPSLPLLQFDAERLPFKPGSFDTVILLEAIYYLRHPERFLAECRRVLGLKGVVLLCMPNPDRPGFIPSPHSTRYFSVPGLTDLFRRGGFTTEIFGAYPTREESGVMTWLRRIARWSGLMPRTLSGRARLKRLIYGKLPRLEGIWDGMAQEESLVPVDPTQGTAAFKNLYAVAAPRRG